SWARQPWMRPQKLAPTDGSSSTENFCRHGATHSSVAQVETAWFSATPTSHGSVQPFVYRQFTNPAHTVKPLSSRSSDQFGPRKVLATSRQLAVRQSSQAWLGTAQGRGGSANADEASR